MKRYTLKYRHAFNGRADFPKDWEYVECPPDILTRPDLPRSNHRFGVIVFAHALTAEEVETFELQEVS